MSDREAFEKWWPSVGQTIGKVAAWKAWQAAQAQAVNQQLLEALVNTQAIIEMLYPKINRPDALNLQIIRNKAAIAAAQEQGK
jgi:hypothetical protein